MGWYNGSGKCESQPAVGFRPRHVALRSKGPRNYTPRKEVLSTRETSIRKSGSGLSRHTIVVFSHLCILHPLPVANFPDFKRDHSGILFLKVRNLLPKDRFNGYQNPLADHHIVYYRCTIYVVHSNSHIPYLSDTFGSCTLFSASLTYPVSLQSFLLAEVWSMTARYPIITWRWLLNSQAGFKTYRHLNESHGF
jgi:hypothetical protein